MTVKQWIEMLKEYPDDKTVIIRTEDSDWNYSGVYVRPTQAGEDDEDVSILVTEVQG